MRRSRTGLLCGAVVLTLVGGLPPAAAMAQPAPSPQPNGHHDMLSGVLHGEGLVQTTNGPVKVAMQKGDATRVTPTTVTVRSTDGFTRTWQVPTNLKVYDKRHTVQSGGLHAGTPVTIAGTAAADSAQFTAKWVVVRSAQPGPTSSP
ncbi:hypothetical protein [Dactylosporangium sp. CA-233914]|uniref:hypothetical protein n=1 Tax=Dactylosporangium sp. CA-233914 TaxID=3239934 RepID=UPI003D913A2F